MNLRSTAICLDCDELIDLSESRKEEKCPRCGSKDHAMLSKYIRPLPVIRVTEVPIASLIEKPVKKNGRKCKKAELITMAKESLNPYIRQRISESVN